MSSSLDAGSKTTRRSQGITFAIAAGLCLFTAQWQHCLGSLPAVTSASADSLRPCWRPQAQATVMFSMYTECWGLCSAHTDLPQGKRVTIKSGGPPWRKEVNTTDRIASVLLGWGAKTSWKPLPLFVCWMWEIKMAIKQSSISFIFLLCFFFEFKVWQRNLLI